MDPARHAFARLRREMVEEQCARRGIADRRVLEALGRVPREAFVPGEAARDAYEDTPLAIGGGQTISQPYIVARMLEAARLEPGARVLDVGTGSGYAAAVAACLAGTVHSIEVLDGLAHAAARRLASLGYANVVVHVGDGSLGLPEHAPFDAILVAAAAPSVPPALREQLAIGGRLVLPVGPRAGDQVLQRITRTGPDAWRTETITPVRFVPLLGEQGYP